MDTVERRTFALSRRHEVLHGRPHIVTTLGRTPVAWVRTAMSSRFAREVVLVAAVVCALSMLVFGGYFLGTSMPQFDFVGFYN